MADHHLSPIRREPAAAVEAASIEEGPSGVKTEHDEILLPQESGRGNDDLGDRRDVRQSPQSNDVFGIDPGNPHRRGGSLLNREIRTQHGDRVLELLEQTGTDGHEGDVGGCADSDAEEGQHRAIGTTNDIPDFKKHLETGKTVERKNRSSHVKLDGLSLSEDIMRCTGTLPPPTAPCRAASRFQLGGVVRISVRRAMELIVADEGN